MIGDDSGVRTTVLILAVRRLTPVASLSGGGTKDRCGSERVTHLEESERHEMASEGA